MPAAWRPGFPVFEAWREIIAETLPAAARTKSIRSIRVPVGATNESGLLEFTEPGFPALIPYSSNNSSAIGYKKRVGRSLRRKWRRRRDSNPRDPCGPNGFQDRPFRPLTHSSEIGR